MLIEQGGSNLRALDSAAAGAPVGPMIALEGNIEEFDAAIAELEGGEDAKPDPGSES